MIPQLGVVCDLWKSFCINIVVNLLLGYCFFVLLTRVLTFLLVTALLVDIKNVPPNTLFFAILCFVKKERNASQV